jgi:hypothetical protein
MCKMELTYLLPANCNLPLEFGEDDVEFLRKLGEFLLLVTENRAKSKQWPTMVNFNASEMVNQLFPNFYTTMH